MDAKDRTSLPAFVAELRQAMPEDTDTPSSEVVRPIPRRGCGRRSEELPAYKKEAKVAAKG